MRGRPLTIRFLEKVNKCSGHFWNGTECWDWTACADKRGYGRIGYHGRPRQAHVVSWIIAKGAEPAQWILHRCDRPSCVNPAHLFEGDVLANNRDAQRKGRSGWLIQKDWGAWAAGDKHWSKHKPESVLKGSANPRAKVTEKDVRRIRRRNSLGISKAALAREYGISEVAIFNMVTRRSWRHVWA